MFTPSPTEIAVRAHTESPSKNPVGSKGATINQLKASVWSLVFDCETSTDAAQRLKLGFFQVRKSGELVREGLFYDPAALTPADLSLIDQYAKARGLEAMTVSRFRFEVFLRVAYEYRGTVIGFNLPFDLSRIAIGYGPARGAMRGGFTFKFSFDRRVPGVRVKHLSAKASLIDFAVPGKQETPRGMRKRGDRVQPHRGSFVDVKTQAAALISQGFSLGRLARFLGTASQKADTDQHGGPITEQYLDYARADVQTTWECYQALVLKLAGHGLGIEPSKVLSEASLGKAYLRHMGISPLLAYQPELPRAIFGTIMSSYYGGRAEVRLRRVPVRVCYTDFKSMYPTVNSLMGLWRFVIGSNLTWADTTPQTRALLDTITLEDLHGPKTWRSFPTLVRVRPEADIFPVRARYDGKINTIGLNKLSSDQPIWFTLADCIASKLLTGKVPAIEQAISFDPGSPQEGLTPINLFGREDLVINPYTDDLFARLIDLRDDMKAKGDPIEKAIKIVANSTVYGIFIEVNRDDAPKPEPRVVFGPDGDCKRVQSTAIEEPGKFFHPMLGTLITGAARLMLAITETLIANQELDYAFCDTDSMAIAKPDGMEEEEFLDRVKAIIDWFEPLNPYRKPGSILKLEDINFDVKTGTMVPLYAFAISAKRYALFNIAANGAPILRKASAHGLGHLRAPYTATEAPTGIPAPAVSLGEIGVQRWQYDLWFKIVEAALAGRPNRVPLDYHPALDFPAVSRYGATSPHLLNWVRTWNAGKPYTDQIKPFGFMQSYSPRTGPFADMPDAEFVDPSQRGRPVTATNPKPVAPFNQDHIEAMQTVFDRDTGLPIRPAVLKTYAEALAQFHLSTEDKFENGDFCNYGRTVRRHIHADSVILIGKEANRVGGNGEPDPLGRDTVTGFRTV